VDFCAEFAQMRGDEPVRNDAGQRLRYEAAEDRDKSDAAVVAKDGWTPKFVMPGLDPGIHVLTDVTPRKTWPGQARP
jgi:hypothetical protein